MNKSSYPHPSFLDQFPFQNLTSFITQQHDYSMGFMPGFGGFLSGNEMEQQDLSKNNKNTNSSTNFNYPEYKKNVNYYHEFWLMYLQNELIIAKMKDYVNEIKMIQGKINQFEEICTNLEKNGQNNLSVNKSKKKVRRTAAEIEKEFKCPYENCSKTYGSDVSLNLHIKLKHGGGNKTEREKIAKNFVMAKLNGDELQNDIASSFPPGYLENFYAFHKNKRKKNFDTKELIKANNQKKLEQSISSSNNLLNALHQENEEKPDENSKTQEDENLINMNNSVA